jgi:hypothetical protein
MSGRGNGQRAPRQLAETRAQRRRRKKQEAKASAPTAARSMSLEDTAKHLALGISLPFRRALQASTVIVATTWACHQHKHLFRWHPGNTLPHAALTALEQRCTVEIYEWLHKAGKTLKVGPELRTHWAELRNHRDYASHAESPDEWDRPEMRTFAKEGRFVRIKTVEIWKATAGIRRLLRAEDRHWLPSEVPLDYNMAIMADAIYRSSMTAEAIQLLPPVPLLFEQLKPAAANYLVQLERQSSASEGHDGGA